MRKLLILFAIVISWSSNAQLEIDYLDWQGNVTTIIRDGLTVKPGGAIFIWNLDTQQFEYAKDDGIWLTFGGGTDDQTAIEVPYTNNSQTTVEGALDDLYLGTVKLTGPQDIDGAKTFTQAISISKENSAQASIALYDDDGSTLRGLFGYDVFANEFSMTNQTSGVDFRLPNSGGANLDAILTANGFATTAGDGSNVLLDNGTVTPVSGLGGSGDLWSDPVDSNILPDADGTRDIGSPSLEFFRLYVENITASNSISGDGSGLTSLSAPNVNVNDVGGYYTGSNLESILQEIGAGGVTASDDQTASEVPFTPTGETTSNNVQDAIVELQNDFDSSITYGEEDIISNGDPSVNIGTADGRVQFTSSATAVTVNFTGQSLNNGDPVLLHIISTNASGTTFTFGANEEDNEGNAAFSVVLAQNEERTLHFVVVNSNLMRCTNYPLATGGSTDDQDATEVNLNPALDVDGDGNNETTVQEAIADRVIKVIPRSTYSGYNETQLKALIQGPDEYVVVPDAAPSGYTVAIDNDPILADGTDSFTITNPEPEAHYVYIFSTSGGATTISGFAQLGSQTTPVTVQNIDLSTLEDGTITLTVYLFNGIGDGSNVLDTATKGSGGGSNLFPNGNAASPDDVNSASGWVSGGDANTATSIANTDTQGGSFAIEAEVTATSNFAQRIYTVSGLNNTPHTIEVRARRITGNGFVDTVNFDGVNQTGSISSSWSTITFTGTPNASNDLEIRIFLQPGLGEPPCTIEISEIVITED